MNTETREIPLTQGLVAIVDAADYPALTGFKWRAMKAQNGNFYAARSVGRNTVILMHRQIMDAKKGEIVDHEKILETLNNRRSNLRFATKAQNNHHKRRQGNNTSGFIGVSKHREKFQARISVEGTQRHLGYFATAQEAADCYDRHAIELYGTFASTNKEAHAEAAA